MDDWKTTDINVDSLCIGCYQYDPVEYRKESLKRIIKEATYHTSEYIFNKLFGEEKE